MNRITVLGCGRWASFHAWYQVEKLHNDVVMWGRAENSHFSELLKNKQNHYVTMPKNIRYSTDLQASIDFADTIIIAIAAQGLQELSQNIGQCNPRNKNFVLCMKGLDEHTGERLSEILSKNIDVSNQICVWVGPGHVEELTCDETNVMVMSGKNAQTVKQMINMFESSLISFVYNDDLLGVEVGAAAKNVIGIAAGILDGLGKSSLKGALMARGCYEVSLLIEKMGGNRMTAFGMSHLGDYEATLFSKNSRNRQYGENFIKNCLSDNIGTAEGVATVKALYCLGKKYSVIMPIINTVYSTLYGKCDKSKIVNNLFMLTKDKEFNYE